MGKRKRINHEEKKLGAAKVEDALEYKPNRCTPKAREIEDISCKIKNNLWYDQHYVGRDTVGEDDGSPREGIDSDSIKSLVTTAFNHLVFYSSTLENFQFVNHNLNGKKARRILIQNSYSSNPTLNVIIETHFIDFNKYETTVKTAMCKPGYVPFDNQYIVEITGDYESTLKHYARGAYRVLGNCQT
ncbi:hypothetical protein BH11BAC7_BH11BAC7_12920 [soil metagenome]